MNLDRSFTPSTQIRCERFPYSQSERQCRACHSHCLMLATSLLKLPNALLASRHLSLRPSSIENPRPEAHVRLVAASNGASVKLAQTQLGHKDPALALRLYQHLFPDDLDELADRMDEVHSRKASQNSRGLTAAWRSSEAKDPMEKTPLPGQMSRPR
jgi:hypothetical protein